MKEGKRIAVWTKGSEEKHRGQVSILSQDSIGIFAGIPNTKNP